MILLGPLAGLVLGLTGIRRQLGLAMTAACAVLAGALLGAASWHDSRSLPTGYWISIAVFALAAIAIFFAARVVRERAR